MSFIAKLTGKVPSRPVTTCEKKVRSDKLLLDIRAGKKAGLF